jgi:putative transposase
VNEIDSANEQFGVHGVKSNRYRQSRLLNETWNLVNKVIKPHLKFKTHHNIRYSPDDFLKVITFAGINHDFAEGTSNYFKISSKRGCPNADTVLYHLKKFSETELLDIHESISDNILTLAKKKGILDKKVDVAIDATEDLYYGNKNDLMVVGTKPQKGTSRAFRYATLTIVEPGCRFTIKVIPMGKSTTKREVVHNLLEYAKKRIKIGNVFLDRGFYQADVISVLNEMDLNFVMPAVLHKKAIRMMHGREPPKILPIEIGSWGKTSKAKLVIILDKNMEKRAFITNIDLDLKRTRVLDHLYSKRWGIETSYRVKKEFRPKTTSKNYIIRLFYFLFSVCLYNLWQLVNITIKILVELAGEKESTITAKVFGRGLFLIFKECGVGPPDNWNQST